MCRFCSGQTDVQLPAVAERVRLFMSQGTCETSTNTTPYSTLCISPQPYVTCYVGRRSGAYLEPSTQFHGSPWFKRISEETNPLVRMIFCLCRCSLWCLEKVLQFITEYAYARAQAKHSNLVLTKIFAATERFARMPFALPALLSLFVFCRTNPTSLR